jgi:ATP sulfurylase
MNKRVIKRLEGIGVNLFRINLSHTAIEKLPELIQFIQSITNVPICLDTEGAQIRTGKLDQESISLAQHDHIKVYSDGRLSEKGILNLSPNLITKEIIEGDYVSIDFNSVFAQVVSKNESDNSIALRILNGGNIGTNKAVTVHRNIPLPPLSEKDINAIEIGKKYKLQHYALSFVNHSDDVDLIRSIAPINSKIISKIECVNALKNLKEITIHSDAILIDRGDLSREVPLESIGMIQKSIIELAKSQETPTYIATNLLESMIDSTTPTRAEINDIFNSLKDGADGLVLAAETAIGKNPIKAVSFISRMMKFYAANEGHKQIFPVPQATNLLADPHGGALNQSKIIKEDIDYSILKKIVMEENDLLDAEQIAIGTFSPLTGFMNRDNLESVLENNRLISGDIWSMPILLQRDISEIDKYKQGEIVTLVSSEGNNHSILEIEEIYEIDLKKVAKRWFGTEDISHPGVKRFFEKGNLILGGKVSLIKKIDSNFKSYLYSPYKCRLIFEKAQWDKVIGFHTRNAPHMAHEYIQNQALDRSHADGLYISPMFGQKKAGDLLPEYVIRSYQILIDEGVYPEEKVILGGFHSYPRYSGPREALFTMICRKNMGCSHFIVGRDHAGVGNFYGSSDAKDFVKRFEAELEIEPIFFDEIVFCGKKNSFMSIGDASDPRSISGTDIRKYLTEGKKIPKHIMRESVQDMLHEEQSKGKEIFYS